MLCGAMLCLTKHHFSGSMQWRLTSSLKSIRTQRVALGNAADTKNVNKDFLRISYARCVGTAKLPLLNQYYFGFCGCSFIGSILLNSNIMVLLAKLKSGRQSEKS